MYKQSIYFTINLFFGLAVSSPVIANNTFIDNNNGTVTDIATGLTWQQQDDDVARVHVSASEYCAELTLASKSDWRLPNIKELPTVSDRRVRAPAIDDAMFPNTNSRPYWTATSVVSNSGSAWFVGLNNGSVSFASKTNGFFVRCVRAEP